MGRPQHFTIDYSHPLARGLVFAGLGNAAGSVRYHDSSSRKNNGALTNMIPAADWRWSPDLHRQYLTLTASRSEKVLALGGPSPAVGVGGCAWFYSGSFPDYGTNFTGFTVGSSYGCGIGTGYNGSVRRCLWAGVNTSHNPPNWTNVTRWWDPPLNTWYHVGFIFSAHSPARTDLYVNGKLVATATVFGSITANGTDINIGFWSLYGAYMDGRIADAMLWTKCYPAYFRQLADRSNYMLSGMIKPIGQSHSIYNLEGVR